MFAGCKLSHRAARLSSTAVRIGVRYSRSRGNALPLGQTRERPDRLSGSFCSNRAEFVKEWSSLLGWIEILHCGKPLT
jgi:hypothetical protein